MTGNEANDTSSKLASAGSSEEVRTVALVGHMRGPDMQGLFDFSSDEQFSSPVSVDWGQIRWIDCYLDLSAVDGNQLPSLGVRTIWVDEDSELIGSYLKGKLIEDCMPEVGIPGGWSGPIYGRGIGPASTIPNCICREEQDR